MVDTSPVDYLRQQRKWSEVMKRAPELKVYDGLNPLIDDIHKSGRPMAIVTNSPDMIPKAFAKIHNWPIDIIIGYHQVSKRKPDPESLILAMKRSGSSPTNTVHIGDRPDDTEASRRAGVFAAGSAWGLVDASALKNSAPDRLFHSIADFREFLLHSP